MTDELVQPSNLEMEEALLGAVMVSEPALDAVLATQLKPKHFYRARNGKVFEAALALADAGEPVDALTLGAELDRRGQLADIGGRAAITQLGSAATPPANAWTYAEQLVELSEWRNVITAGQQIATAGFAQDPDALATAEALLSRREGVADFEFDSDRQNDLIWAMAEAEGGERAMPWPFDRLTERAPILPGQLIVLSAPTNTGKSVFADQVLDKLHFQHGADVALYMNEGSVGRRTLRRIARRTQVETSSIRDGQLAGNEPQLLTREFNEHPTWPIIDITGWHVQDVARHIRLAGRDLVVVDLLNRFDIDPKIAERSYAAIVNTLADAAILSDTAVLLVSQLNRGWAGTGGPMTQRRPTKSDLKGSGDIETHADTIVFIYRQPYPPPDEMEMSPEGEIYIDKAKDGELGLVKVVFKPKRMRFERLRDADIAPPPGPPEAFAS